MIRKLGIYFLILISAIAYSAIEAKGDSAMIESGKRVKFDYTLTVNGEKIDSSERSGPIEYTHGDGAIIPGLERNLEGLAVGEEKTFVIAAEDGYGPVNPQLFREVPKTSFPGEIQLQVGLMLQLKDNQGKQFPVVVAQINENTVILNLNHPLAGQELTFNIAVLSVQ